MTPQEILLKAADLIEKHGLAKGRQIDEQGQMCAAGAISFAAYGKVYQLFYGAGHEALQRITQLVPTVKEIVFEERKTEKQEKKDEKQVLNTSK